MLNISGIHEGFVLDHIQAGMSLQIYHDLKLDKLDCSVAIIKSEQTRPILSEWLISSTGFTQLRASWQAVQTLRREQPVLRVLHGR